jgi:hypothetical protein
LSPITEPSASAQVEKNVRPPKRARKAEKVLEDSAATFIEEGWKLTEGLELNVPCSLTLLSRPTQDLTKLLFEFIPKQVWKIMVSSVNETLAKGETVSTQDPRRRPTSVLELIRFYGTWLLIENTWGNDTHSFREHYKHICKEYGKVPRLGMDRMQLLISSLRPSIQQLQAITEILNEAWMTAVDHISTLLLDETIAAYQPSAPVKQEHDASGEPIPVVFIPRKPHPNGLELLHYSTLVGDPNSNGFLPYTLYIIPHLQQGDASPLDAVRTFLSRWPFPNKPHFVADAGFGTWEILDTIKNWGGTATISFPVGTQPWIWELLSYNLPIDHWRAATKGN